MKLLISSTIICIVAILYFYHIRLSPTLTSLLQQYTGTNPFSTAHDSTDSPSLRASSHNKSTSSSFFGLPLIPAGFFAPAKQANMTVPRGIAQAFLAIEQSEGAGARVRRSIGYVASPLQNS